MKPTFLTSILIFEFVFFSCSIQQRTTTIEGVDYDIAQNQTNYTVLPYGSISIPGKWEKGNFNSVSVQQFFVNQDSVKIAIALNKFNKYEFNSKGTKREMEFVEGFYEWDSKYFVDSYGLNREILEKDSLNKFIVYKIFGTFKNAKFNTYFLIGERNEKSYNISIPITEKWNDKEKIDFLKKIFLKI